MLYAITNKCESILQLNFTKDVENVTNDDLPLDEELVLAEEPELQFKTAILLQISSSKINTKKSGEK